MEYTSALPAAFTSDPRVLHEAALLWPFVAAMQPLGGAVFALDGILIGAGDTRYLMWSMLAASAVFIALRSFFLRRKWPGSEPDWPFKKQGIHGS